MMAAAHAAAKIVSVHPTCGDDPQGSHPCVHYSFVRTTHSHHLCMRSPPRCRVQLYGVGYSIRYRGQCTPAIDLPRKLSCNGLDVRLEG